MSSLSEKIDHMLDAGYIIKIEKNTDNKSPYSVACTEIGSAGPSAVGHGQCVEDAADNVIDALVTDAEEERDELRQRQEKYQKRFELLKEAQVNHFEKD